MDVLDELSFATGLPFAVSRVRPFNGSPICEAMTVDDIDVAVLPLAVPPRIVITDDSFGARGHYSDWSTDESNANTILGALATTRALAGDAT